MVLVEDSHSSLQQWCMPPNKLIVFASGCAGGFHLPISAWNTKFLASKYSYVCVDMSVLRYVWVFMHFWSILVNVIFTYFSLYLVGSNSKTSVSHYRYVLFCINRSEWQQIYWFWSFHMGFWNYQKWPFHASCQGETKSTICYPWNWQWTISSEYKFTWMFYDQFFKIHTHLCFLCLETSATSRDKTGTSLVAHMGLFGGVSQSWLCIIVRNNSLVVILKLKCSQL